MAAAGAVAAGVWVSLGPLADARVLRLELLSLGGVATGAALILCGAGVACLAARRQLLARLFGLPVAVLATSGLVVDHPAVAATPVGQMAWAWLAQYGWIDPTVAQLVVVCALGLFLPVQSGAPRLRQAALTFASAVLLVGGLARVAVFVSGSGMLWYPFGSAPLTVAAGLAALGVGLLAAGRHWAESDWVPGPFADLPITVGIVIAALAGVMWRSLAADRGLPSTELAHHERTRVAAALQSALTQRVEGLRHLTTVTFDEGGAIWARAAHAQLSTSTAIVALAAVTATSETRFEVSYGQKRRGVIDLKSGREGKAIVRAARTTRVPVISGPMSLDGDNDAFLIVVPNPPPQQGGFVAGLYRYHELVTAIPDVHRVGLEVAAGATTVFRSGPARPRGVNPVWLTIPVHGTEWRVRAWRGGTPLVSGQSALPEIVLGLGLFVALIAGLTAQLLTAGATRARATRAVNTELRQEIERRRQMERQLAAARDAALEAAKAKSAFLATVSHEIRTPMNGVIGTVSLLLETPLLSEQREYAEQIRRSADSLVTIINDILDFSKIEAGKLSLESVDFDPRAALHDAVDVVAPTAQGKGLELICDCHPLLPAELRGDPSRLRQMLLNLLGNAVKFTQTGTVHATMALEPADGEGHLVRVTVADTGIGIKPDALSRLFAPFSQADGSMTRRYGGTGLGLAITRQLAEIMGGQVGVESAEGRGASFWFTARFGDVPPRVQVRSSQPLNGLRILLVDDQPASLRTLAEDLQAAGATVQATSASEEMFRIAASPGSGGPQVALIDESISMRGGMLAVEAVRRLAALPPLPAILLTVRNRAEGVAIAQRLGFASCLVKPARRQQLVDALIAVAGRAASTSAAQPLEPAKPVTRSLRVLVAEDNEVNQKVVVRMLERLGHRPELAVNGREAVEAVGRAPYDLVLMDCQMPEMDGFEATARIRQLTAGRRHLPIVALTANASESDRQRCLDAGMDGHLAKPLKLDRLAEALSAWTTPVPVRAEEKRPA